MFVNVGVLGRASATTLSTSRSLDKSIFVFECPIHSEIPPSFLAPSAEGRLLVRVEAV